MDEELVSVCKDPSKPRRKASQQVYFYLGPIILLYLVSRIVLNVMGH